VDLLSVPAPDFDARRAAIARHTELAVPAGALGRLAELGVWLAAAQGSCPPRPPAQPRIVVVAADHGVDEWSDAQQMSTCATDPPAFSSSVPSRSVAVTQVSPSILCPGNRPSSVGVCTDNVALVLV